MDAQTCTLPLLRFCIGTCVYVQTWTHKQMQRNLLSVTTVNSCAHRHARTHTHIWVLLTAVKQMNLCMRLTALSACGRYTKCSLSLVSSPCSKTLSLHSQYMLSCSFVLKAKQTSLFFSACIFLPIQTRRKQKKKKPKKGCRHTRTRAERLPVPGFKLHRCSWGLITDVISCNFSLNFLAVQHFLSCFPIEMKKCKWMKF